MVNLKKFFTQLQSILEADCNIEVNCNSNKDFTVIPDVCIEDDGQRHPIAQLYVRPYLDVRTSMFFMKVTFATYAIFRMTPEEGQVAARKITELALKARAVEDFVKDIRWSKAEMEHFLLDNS